MKDMKHHQASCGRWPALLGAAAASVLWLASLCASAAEAADPKTAHPSNWALFILVGVG